MIAAAFLPVMLAACSPVVVPAGERVQAPHLTDTAYVAADGTSLPLAVWPAADGKEPKAIILGLHGFGDYRNAFEKPADTWSKAGITTYAYDQRGFGQSPTRNRWPGTDTLADDAMAVVTLLHRKYPGVPLYVAGESMGGAVALVAADRGMVSDGLILSAPAVRSRESLGPFVTGGVWVFTHLMPWMPAGPTSIDFEPTDDPKTIEKLQKDPLMLRQPRFDMGAGLLDLMDAGCAAAENIHEPYLLMHGLADRIVPDGPVKDAITIMPVRPDSKLAFYKKGHHLLMRDKEGATVSRDVVAWMTNHEAPLPSGADAERTEPKIAATWGTRRATAAATTMTPTNISRGE
ncbi:MAG TPA: alpha/beta fold hydrolase [Reyranella sp.]|nr:alpha/beta fold hydrolase [Reyranella sp.]